MTKPEPVIRAVEAGGRAVDDPTCVEVHDLLADMNLSHPYVIVERRDREPAGHHYMQVCLNDDFSYQVEYREGREELHFQAHVPAQGPVIGPEPVAKVIDDWMRDGDAWRTALAWTPLFPQEKRQVRSPVRSRARR
ncbi:hypothetical protein AB0K02_04430 [Streptomyces sp. NPDC049597]|uniref:hypothetical protein n=1 Tax=Streptomyces sp. NPDC049597 TaxID=3155276 RepID=UPI00341DCCFF